MLIRVARDKQELLLHVVLVAHTYQAMLVAFEGFCSMARIVGLASLQVGLRMWFVVFVSIKPTVIRFGLEGIFVRHIQRLSRKRCREEDSNEVAGRVVEVTDYHRLFLHGYHDPAVFVGY